MFFLFQRKASYEIRISYCSSDVASSYLIPRIGPVTATFSRVTSYGSPGGRIAVGISVVSHPQKIRQAPTHGRIWATAIPVNEPGSAKVRFADVRITGDTDGIGGDLLIKLGQSPGFAELIDRKRTRLNSSH